jgi:ATP-binding cassette subfamily F protein uup
VKLSYKLQRELDGLPDLIEELETEVAALQAEVTAPEFYAGDHVETREKLEALASVQAQLERAVERWAELEAHGSGASEPQPRR